MDFPIPWPLLVGGLALGIPLTFALAAALPSRIAPIRRASFATWIALGLALLVVASEVWEAIAAAFRAAAAPGSLPTLGLRLDAVTSVMLLLITTIALVLARYSRTYLDGDPGHPRYTRWLLTTLAAVTLLVIANDLLVIVAAWIATSLALHQLLTFYDDRPQALVAAHKKFLVSRLADACLVAAVALVGVTVGSLELDAIDAWARTTDSLPTSLHVATVLLVAAASLKSAQIPFHGWLTQVMEAPTPVSALLHAGVVNIGGFLMIRLAPLMAHAAIAQTLLVIVGTTTAVVAALVMTTRVSIKVALAWSTCAQMGLMLVECGLGAWHLALLHLVAHSLYKAHAFLASGGTVEAWRAQSIAPQRQPPVSLARVWAAAAVVVAVLALAAIGLHTALGPSDLEGSATTLVVLLLGFSLAPLVARGSQGGSAIALSLRCGALLLLYVAWHAAFGGLLATDSTGGTWVAWAVVVLGLTTLFALQVALQAHPHGRLSRALHPMLFAGFYLDELFTRMTFRLWPPRLPSAVSRRARPLIEAQEA